MPEPPAAGVASGVELGGQGLRPCRGGRRAGAGRCSPRCPNGSTSWPWRSPQDASASGWRSSAPPRSPAHRRRRRPRARDYCGAADRRRREHAHLREFVGQVHHGPVEAELERRHPSVGGRDALDLLGAEGVSVEGGRVSALDDGVRGDRHAVSIWPACGAVLDVLARAHAGRLGEG
jgi:hypothetical protein